MLWVDYEHRVQSVSDVITATRSLMNLPAAESMGY
jgi:hypothetical protein